MKQRMLKQAGKPARQLASQTLRHCQPASSPLASQPSQLLGGAAPPANQGPAFNKVDQSEAITTMTASEKSFVHIHKSSTLCAYNALHNYITVRSSRN